MVIDLSEQEGLTLLLPDNCVTGLETLISTPGPNGDRKMMVQPDTGHHRD